MESLLLPAVAVAAIIAVGALVLLILRRGSATTKDKPRARPLRHKDRNTILRDANRRLAQNPRDPEALEALARLHFEEQDWEKAFRSYRTLVALCASVPTIDEFTVTLRYAQSALQLKNYKEAYKSFGIARTLNAENFEVNYNLGFLEYAQKAYPKAASYLNKARSMNPDHASTNRYLGHSLFHLRKFADAITALRRALDFEPDDKRTVFTLAQCHFELGQSETALRIFSSLRTDAVLGPHACLYAGTIGVNTKQYQKAIMDLEIGLRHEKLPRPVMLELKYRLASAHLKNSDLGTAVKIWNEIADLQPDYKDVRAQLTKYQEISSNRDLQIFLMSSSSEFVTLCRRIASRYFEKAATKLVDISLSKADYVDVLAEVSTPKWEEIVLFRFVRSTETIGELLLRELYARIKDLKAGRGICLTTGTFSDEARRFVEARLIDLVEKEDLMKLFKRISVAA